MLYSIIWLFIQILYTSCNKLPNLKSNVHLDEQPSTSYMDRDPYRSSIFPLSIAPWWELLKEKGLFDTNDTSLYGREISSIHAFLAAFANEHFSCSGDGGHAYYALVKAFKFDYNLGKKSFLTALTCHPRYSFPPFGIKKNNFSNLINRCIKKTV